MLSSLSYSLWLSMLSCGCVYSLVIAAHVGDGLGFGITPNFTDRTLSNEEYLGCNIYGLLSGYVDYGDEALKIFANVSDTMSVPVHTVGQDQYVYVANPQTSRLSLLDYTVGTYAIHSQCKPVTPQCTNKSMQVGNSINHTCPFASKGTVDTLDRTGNVDVTMAFFKDSSGSKAIMPLETSLNNPYYYAAMLLTGLNMAVSEALANDPDMLCKLYDSGTLVAVFCNSTVYDVTYSSVNGTIKEWKASPSNSSMMRLVQAGTELLRMGMWYLIQAVSVAGFSDNGQDIADRFALAYSRNAIATTAVIFEPRDAFVSQKREQIQVAMVPKAPLYILIAANLLLVVFGSILTALALIASRGNTGEVQARLSIHALVAAAFEPRVGNPVKEVKGFFEEKHSKQGPRLGFVKTTEGGWMLERYVAK